MPTAALKPCSHPGCGALTANGRCDKHPKPKSTNYDYLLSRQQRGYGRAWEKIRTWVLARDCGLCQVCAAAGRYTVGNIVDHIIPKSQQGTDDEENLQTICRPCHNEKSAREAAFGKQNTTAHPHWLPVSKVPVIVVSGPPASGKSTYVHEHAGPRDLILDVDEIAQELFGGELYSHGYDQRMAAVRYRNKMLATLAQPQEAFDKVWITVAASTEKTRKFWREKYGELIVMPTPRDECLRRLAKDERRSAEAKRRARELIMTGTW